MKPVYQRNLRGPALEPDDPPAGDCMAACLASLLELDLEEVPNWGDDRTPEVAAELERAGTDGARRMAWWTALRRWLRTEGLDLAAVPGLEHIMWNAPVHECHAVAVIPSPRGGWNHVVVIDGLGFIVHDPYPGPSSAVGRHIDRLGVREVLVLIPPYDPFPDVFEEGEESEASG